MGMQPKTARILSDGKLEEVPLSTVEVGDVLEVRAGLGCIPMSWRMDEAVPSLAFSSSSRPVRTKVMIITEASK